jgi:phosphoglycerol transferase MdoB-like AlkP superfamily enzyme
MRLEINSIAQRAQNILIPIILVTIYARILETSSFWYNPFVGFSIVLHGIAGLCTDIIIALLYVTAYTVASVIVPASLHRAIKVLFASIFVIYTGLSIALSSYFQLLLYPLDKVIFSFQINEIWHIAHGASAGAISELAPFIGAIAVFLGGLWLAPKIKPSKYLLYFTLAASLFAAIWHLAENNTKYTQSLIGRYVAENRLFQIFRYNEKALFTINSDTTFLTGNAEMYQKIHSEHNFVSTEYPLLRVEDYSNDVLAPFFEFTEQKPNLVFIIVESLGSSISGPGAKNGSNTPYIDSLIEHSLYWENQFSTAERTFEMFPSSLASLPYGNEGFTRLPNMPKHHSIISLLKHNGYYTAFYHAADFKIYFDNWWRFFATQGIDTILDIHNFPKYEGFDERNGQPDEILFSNVRKCLAKQKDKPSLSILLTTSMHEPYLIPEQEMREAEAKAKVLADAKHSSRQKKIMLHDINRTASVYYTDTELHKFIDGCKEDGTYANTIFVIAGDHSLYNFDPHNQAEQYRVPLIIYSPLIKKPMKFSGINSHLDITPTLLCLLKNEFDLKLPGYTHWLGNRLDTSSAPASKRIPFMSVSRICKDYLRGNEYLSGTELYDYRNGEMEKKDDPEIYNELKNELENFMYINQYVCVHNKLLPDSVYYAFSRLSKTIKNENIPISEDMDPVHEFFMLENTIMADSLIKNYTARLNFMMKSSETNNQKLPRLIIDASNPATGQRISYQLEYLSRKDLKPLASNQWQEIIVSQSSNLLNYTGDSLHISVYLWNHESTPIYYKDMRYELIGTGR